MARRAADGAALAAHLNNGRPEPLASLRTDHHSPREQFRANSEQSSATPSSSASAQIHPANSSPPTPLSLQQTQTPRTLIDFGLTIASADASRASHLADNGLPPQHTSDHSKLASDYTHYRALDRQLARAAIDSLYNATSGTNVTTMTAPADAYSSLFSNHCRSAGQDCDTAGRSQTSLMNIRTEELNFSEIKDVWLVKSWQEILLRVALVAPIVLLGLVGNLTIIYSMCKFKPIRSKPTNIFILNMALADLLTTIVCPNAALLTDVFQFYVLGSFVCRFEGFIKVTCLLVSAYSLLVLSFDWFLCVVKPCRTRISIRQSWLALVSIWCGSIAMALPLFFWRSLRRRHWRDLVEVWCCELIQYTKYYWVCITLFLIYLPTVVMTIVLVVILVQMDRFEAKLRRSRRPAAAMMATSSGSASNIRETSTTLHSHTALSVSGFGGSGVSVPSKDRSHIQRRGAGRGDALSSSISVTIKYRRRIVKILFYYLLTSIVCWTPLQFVIIYRHFRTEAVPANWFFELAFYSQLCASLSAAMNPIIFGFLSQPFRRVVTTSWMFRFLDKVWTNTRNRSDNGKNENFVMDQRRLDNHHQQVARNDLSYARASRRTTRVDLDQTPRLTIDYVEHDEKQISSATGARAAPSGAVGPTAGRDNCAYTSADEHYENVHRDLSHKLPVRTFQSADRSSQNNPGHRRNVYR